MLNNGLLKEKSLRINAFNVKITIMPVAGLLNNNDKIQMIGIIPIL